MDTRFSHASPFEMMRLTFIVKIDFFFFKFGVIIYYFFKGKQNNKENPV